MLHMAGVFFRAGAFLFLLPLLNRPVPVLVRVALAAYLALIAVAVVEPAADLAIPGHWWGLAIFAVKESFLGFSMALSVLLVFYIVQATGQLLSQEIGLMQSNMFNPMMGEQESVLGTGMSLLTIVFIFLLNVDHQIIYAFLRSFTLVPVGSAVGEASHISFVLHQLGKIFLTSVQLAAPLIAVNYIVTLSFAFLGRVVPSMNVLVLSFSARLGVGFFILILIFYMLAQVLLSEVLMAPERMLKFLPL